MSPDLKARIYGILEPGGEDSRYFDPFILGLIVLNVGAVVLETVESIYNSYAFIFNAFEIFSVAVFSLEYILRVWSCTEIPDSEILCGAGCASCLRQWLWSISWRCCPSICPLPRRI